MRSSVSCRVVYSSLRKPLNSEPVDLRTTRSLTPETTQARGLVAAAVARRDDRGADLAAALDEGVVVAGAADVDAVPGVLLDLDPAAPVAAGVTSRKRCAEGRARSPPGS